MFRKFILSSALMLMLVISALLTSGATLAAPNTTLYQEGDSHISFSDWYNNQDTGYSGGSARWGINANLRLSFRFTGTAVTWVTSKSPFAGKAEVWLDGSNKGIVNLYAATTTYKHLITYAGLADKQHTIVIKVLGKGKPNSYNVVVVDAFIVGNQTTEDTSPKIVYNGWKANSNAHANGGGYRINRKKGASFSIYGLGSTMGWVTAMGPTYGKAEVFVNGVSQGIVDLYAPTQQWQVVKTFTSTFASDNTLTVQVLDDKNPASTGTQVIMDAVTTN